MKRSIIVILCICIFLVTIYVRINETKYLYEPNNTITLNSPNNKTSAKIIIGYSDNHWLSVEGKIDLYLYNETTKHSAKAILLKSIDYNISHPKLIWCNNNQLDIYIENNANKKGITNYFFKDLGNINVSIHYLYKKS